MLPKALFIGALCVVALLIVAALLHVVPSTAALLVALAGLVLTVGTLVSFWGPDIKLVHVRDGITNLTSGYSAGVPSTWNVVVRLIAVNNGARRGILSRFQIDTLEVEHLPRPPRAFQVIFSGLERAGGNPDRGVPLSLPLLLASKARERVECRAVLSFLTADPNVLADDLREVSGFRVKFRYWSGTESRPTKERSGNLHLTYDELRRGLRSYWAGAPQFAQLVRRLDTGQSDHAGLPTGVSIEVKTCRQTMKAVNISDTQAGLGPIVVGMQRHGYDLSLTHDRNGWRATFLHRNHLLHPWVGQVLHWWPTPWRAVQEAAWRARHTQVGQDYSLSEE